MNYDSLTMDQHKAARIYLSCAHERPRLETLAQVAIVFRDTAKLPIARLFGSQVMIDFARHEAVTPKAAERYLNQAEELIDPFESAGAQDVEPQHISTWMQAGIVRAELPKIRSVLVDQTPPSLELESATQERLLALGQSTLRLCLENSRLDRRLLFARRGMQISLGALILNGRGNLKNGEVAKHMWLPLPRQRDPHDNETKKRTAYNLAYSEVGYLDEASQLNIGLYGAEARHETARSVKVIEGDRDLGTTTTADIISAALRERNADNADALRTLATIELDTLYDAFQRKIHEPSV